MQLQQESASWQQLLALYPAGTFGYERITFAIAMNDLKIAVYKALRISAND
jgi:hypothetical protein